MGGGGLCLAAFVVHAIIENSGIVLCAGRSEPEHAIAKQRQGFLITL